MANLNTYYRTYLSGEYELRAEKNFRYSKNAFASFLGLTPSYYSKMMNGKILLSLDLADNISKKLKMEESVRERFVLSVAEEQKCHSLYLIDPSLTTCSLEDEETNQYPKSRK